jgi:hypothetical protein
LPVEKIAGRGIATRLEPRFRRLIFGPAVPAAELVKADICHDTIQPSIETALEAEAMQILVNFQESFLVDVAGVFWLVQNVQGDSEDVAVVAMHERFKRFAIARLRAFDQRAVIWHGQGAPRRSGGSGTFSAVSAAISRPCDCHSVSCHMAAFTLRNGAFPLNGYSMNETISNS